MSRIGNRDRINGVTMRAIGIFMIVMVMGAVAPSWAIKLADRGKAVATVVIGNDSTLPERTAATELVTYLSKVTGASFESVAEKHAPHRGPRVFVGVTQRAAQLGCEPAKLGPEEWVIRSAGDDLILVGGRPRGTLYAVYHFLEDVIGVHWWNAYEESVPHKPSLSLPELNRRGQPRFQYRDIYTLYANDGGRFAARNRLNRQGDAPIEAQYGGSMNYGPPYHVHTFYLYFPPKQYFQQHPDWYSLVNGKRTGDRAQLCLTNPSLREAFLAKLKATIRKARADAEKAGTPAPRVYDVSQNDCGGMCLCNKCQAIAKAEGSEAGPLLDFINYLADGIRQEFPDVYIDTLAYQMTQQAPKTIKPRDNVIIRLCDTTSNFTKPITDPENKPFRDHLLSWAKIAKNLRIWDYAVTYAPYYGLPLPTVQTYPVDYQFYASHHVEGVFTEHEYPILADLRDFKIWMMMKLLEDPYQDYDALVRTFTDGFYGPAGRDFRDYLQQLEAASNAKPSYLSMGASPRQYRYLDLAFIRHAQSIFDHAEQAVAGDATLLRRVSFARLPLDRATLVLFPTLMQEWVAGGGEPSAMPIDRDAVAKRCLDTWMTQIDFRIPAPRRNAERLKAKQEVAVLAARKAYVPLPEKFRNLPRGTVFDYTADADRNWKNIANVVPDPEAESGITSRLEFPTKIDTDRHPLDRYKLPMQWGLYDQINHKSPGSAVIKPEDVPGPGYHWYKLGTFEIGPSYYVYFFWSWIIQVDVDNVADPGKPNRKFDVWARIKFEGPAFPHGKATDKNAICVERVDLVKAGAE